MIWKKEQHCYVVSQCHERKAKKNKLILNAFLLDIFFYKNKKTYSIGFFLSHQTLPIKKPMMIWDVSLLNVI